MRFPSWALACACLLPGSLAAAEGVAVKVELQYEQEPVLSHEFANPCAYDREGKPVKTAKDCAGVVKAYHRPRMMPEWKTEESGGRVTAYLESVQVPLILEQTLRISSDYPKDSCAFKATLEHETKHWKANVALFRRKAALIQRSLEKLPLPSKDKPLVSTPYSSDRMREQFDRLINETIKAKRDELTSEMQESVAELDDPLRYRQDDYSKCSPEQWKGK